VRNSHY